MISSFIILTIVSAEASSCAPETVSGAQEMSQTMSEIKPPTIDWQTSYEDALKLAKENKRPIFILFTGKKLPNGKQWCPSCVVLDKQFLNHPRFINEFKDKFVFVRIEVTVTEEVPKEVSSLMSKFGATGVPNIFTVNSEGENPEKVTYVFNDPGKEDGLDLFIEKLSKYEDKSTAAETE